MFLYKWEDGKFTHAASSRFPTKKSIRWSNYGDIKKQNYVNLRQPHQSARVLPTFVSNGDHISCICMLICYKVITVMRPVAVGCSKRGSFLLMMSGVGCHKRGRLHRSGWAWREARRQHTSQTASDLHYTSLLCISSLLPPRHPRLLTLIAASFPVWLQDV